MSSSRTRRWPKLDWRDNDTVVVDMSALLAQQRDTVVEAVVISPPRRRGAQPPPLTRALARQRLAVHQRDRVLLDQFRRELEASERARAQLARECRELRATVNGNGRDTREGLARARLHGTIDHLRGEVERTKQILARERANTVETTRALQDTIDELARVIEQLQRKVAHLERERERVTDQLEEAQMDRAGQAMQIAHLKMSLSDNR